MVDYTSTASLALDQSLSAGDALGFEWAWGNGEIIEYVADPVRCVVRDVRQGSLRRLRRILLADIGDLHLGTTQEASSEFRSALNFADLQSPQECQWQGFAYAHGIVGHAQGQLARGSVVADVHRGCCSAHRFWHVCGCRC